MIHDDNFFTQMTKRPVLMLLPRSIMEGVVRDGLELRRNHGLKCGENERRTVVQDIWEMAGAGESDGGAGTGQSWEELGD